MATTTLDDETGPPMRRGIDATSTPDTARGSRTRPAPNADGAPDAGAGARPAIVIVDGPAGLPAVRAEIEQRYGAAYTVLATSSPRAAHNVLRGLAAAATDVALVVAAPTLPDAGTDPGNGTELLALTRELHPTARRGLLIDRGEERAAPAFLTDAVALGHMDHFVTRPVRPADERFHRAVTGFLDEWWRQRGDDVPVATVVADAHSADGHTICDLLTRHDLPHRFHPADSDEGRAVLAAAGVAGERRPVTVTADGTVLVDPTNREAGRALGARVDPSRDEYDLTVVGGGPAGLAAAVHAASEGLRTAVIEPRSLGGQAGTSSLIRNYLGFPRGISGAELTARALQQAKVLGAEVLYGSAAAALHVERDSGALVLTRNEGAPVRSRTLIVATGVAYRRLTGPGIERLAGRGVIHGSAVSEARSLAGRHVVVVGGGNSAGQAALHLSRYAARVTMLVRAPALSVGMSRYLVTEIEARSTIAVRARTEVVDALGRDRLDGLLIRGIDTGAVTTMAADALVVMIGGRPHTGWLPAAVRRDDDGYVLTGADAGAGVGAGGAAGGPFATALAGVFAVGDVRHGSVKRVAAAVGEGSACIPAVHAHLAASQARAGARAW